MKADILAHEELLWYVERNCHLTVDSRLGNTVGGKAQNTGPKKKVGQWCSELAVEIQKTVFWQPKLFHKL